MTIHDTWNRPWLVTGGRRSVAAGRWPRAAGRNTKIVRVCYIVLVEQHRETALGTERRMVRRRSWGDFRFQHVSCTMRYDVLKPLCRRGMLHMLSNRLRRRNVNVVGLNHVVDDFKNRG